MKTTKMILTELGACPDAVEWAGRKTPEKAWAMCPRADWLIWIAEKLGVGWKLPVLAACACARTALKYIPAGENWSRIAIETAEACTRGEATLEQLADAADDAHVAYDTAYDAAVACAAYAAYAAAAAVDDATYAADAADAAAHAADEGADEGARAEMAGIVRRIIPFSIIKQAIKEGGIS